MPPLKADVVLPLKWYRHIDGIMGKLTHLNTSHEARDGDSSRETPVAMDSALYQDGGRTYAMFNGLRLDSHYQPIFKGGILIFAVGLSTLARRYARSV